MAGLYGNDSVVGFSIMNANEVNDTHLSWHTSRSSYLRPPAFLFHAFIGIAIEISSERYREILKAKGTLGIEIISRNKSKLNPLSFYKNMKNDMRILVSFRRD